MALVHHELCFGCGRMNLFGLLLEAEPSSPGVVTGRCFIKQDHQGADTGCAHEGIVAGALGEAMALACGPQARVHSLEVKYFAPAPVGGFLEIEAVVKERRDEMIRAAATAKNDGTVVAEASGFYR